MPPLARGRGAAAARPYALVAHIYYHDLWEEIAETIAAARPDADLLVSITDRGEETDALITRITTAFPEARCFRFPNRGRDILPFVHLLNAGLLDGYAAVGKIHTKRSPHRSDGDHWRRHLMRGILPPDGGSSDLLARFLAEPEAAIWVADGQHYRSDEWWGSNRVGVRRLLQRLEIRVTSDDLAFPAGSMYWLKPVMIAMIKGMLLDPDEFELETGAGRRHAGACLRAGAGLRRRLGRHAHLRDRRADRAARLPRRRRRRPTSAPSTCRSSTRCPRTTPGGARASPNGPPSPGRGRTSPATCSRSCRPISASTTCACPR